MKNLEQIAKEKCLAMAPTDDHQSYLVPRGMEDGWKQILKFEKGTHAPYLHRVEDHTYVVFPKKSSGL